MRSSCARCAADVLARCDSADESFEWTRVRRARSAGLGGTGGGAEVVLLLLVPWPLALGAGPVETVEGDDGEPGTDSASSSARSRMLSGVCLGLVAAAIGRRCGARAAAGAPFVLGGEVVAEPDSEDALGW